MARQATKSKRAVTARKKARAKQSPRVDRGKILEKIQTQLATDKTAKRKGAKYLRPNEAKELVMLHFDSALRIAWSMLNRWRVRIPQDEVQSITGMALCEAATRFDKSLGVSFRTFFFYHLRGLLLREISRRISEYRSSSPIENAEANYAASKEPVDSSQWPYALVDTNSPEKQVTRDQISKITWEACAELDELERDIIVRFFVHEETVADIAKDLGYCRCHVSRVKSRALATLSRRLTPLLAESESESDSHAEDGEFLPLRQFVKVHYRGGRGRRKGSLTVNETLSSLQAA